MKKKAIAESIGVSPSTITREVRRNSGRYGHYNWETAQKNAAYHRHRRPGNHAVRKEVRDEVLRLLAEEQWSPEQISGHLALHGIHVSHETIYRWIRRDKAEGGTLYKHCRHRLKHRKRPVGGRRMSIPDRVSIAERPAEADGKRFGDFEMDTIVGKDGHGAIVTLVERSTGMLLMRKLKHGKNARKVAETVIHLLMPYKGVVRTITTDNGTEFACHRRITRSIGAKVYFADPYSSWQKGAVENVNGLVRQYIPKSVTFNNVSQQKITRIMDKINRRPRKKLNFLSPKECFNQHLSYFCTC